MEYHQLVLLVPTQLFWQSMTVLVEQQPIPLFYQLIQNP